MLEGDKLGCLLVSFSIRRGLSIGLRVREMHHMGRARYSTFVDVGGLRLGRASDLARRRSADVAQRLTYLNCFTFQ